MDNHVFIGTGNNPHGPELPLGFGMELPQHPEALETFSGMTQSQREAVIRFVQGGNTGEEAHHRVDEAIRRLCEGDKSGF